MPIKAGARGNAGHCPVPSQSSGLQLARTDFSAWSPQLHGLPFSPDFLVLLKAGKKQESSEVGASLLQAFNPFLLSHSSQLSKGRKVLPKFVISEDPDPASPPWSQCQHHQG